MIGVAFNPHLRGKYDARGVAWSPLALQSPLAWEIRISCLTSWGLDPSIPTCVGNTQCGRCAARCMAFNPHLRGKYTSTVVPSTTVPSIPTCVGNTLYWISYGAATVFNPHLRGKYPLRLQLLRTFSLQSPLAWEILLHSARPGALGPSIPTCVENTPGSPICQLLSPFNPHLRGKYRPGERPGRARCLQSPLAWEIPHPQHPYMSPEPSIPTCVGNTTRSSAQASFPSFNPHLRGKYRAGHVLNPVHTLQSPLAWEIQRWPAKTCRCKPSIPTCVGNTLARRSRAPTSSFNPHLRGKYGCPRFTRGRGYLQSPLAWEIPPARSCPRLRPPSIPTCVGNTPRSENLHGT